MKSIGRFTPDIVEVMKEKFRFYTLWRCEIATCTVGYIKTYCILDMEK